MNLHRQDAIISAARAPANLRTTLSEISKTAYVDVKEHFVEKFGKKATVFDENVPVRMPRSGAAFLQKL